MFEQLQRLYPQAQAVAPDAVLPGYLIVQLGDQGLAIPQADLTSKEEELLLMMSLAKATPQVPVVDLAPHQQAWRAFLLEGQPLDAEMRGSLVCIYLIMQAKSETFDPVLWQQTLEDSLEAIEVVIPDEANRWLVCLRGMEHVGALVDIIKTLDIDFETVTRGCVGLVAKLDQDYVAHFQDERRLVHSILSQIMEPEIVPLTSVLLRLVGREVTKQYAFMDRLHDVLKHNPDYAATVRALFEHQGNLSHAADELYIHRNTLTYRLSKYTKETGLNLQHLTDLIVSYLALEHKG